MMVLMIVSLAISIYAIGVVLWPEYTEHRARPTSEDLKLRQIRDSLVLRAPNFSNIIQQAINSSNKRFKSRVIRNASIFIEINGQSTYSGDGVDFGERIVEMTPTGHLICPTADRLNLKYKITEKGVVYRTPEDEAMAVLAQ